MQNVLMQYCRETNRFSRAKIARHMGIEVSEYRKMESGKRRMTAAEAALLGRLYKVKGTHFYRAALQVELLIMRKEMIRVLKKVSPRIRCGAGSSVRSEAAAARK